MKNLDTETSLEPDFSAILRRVLELQSEYSKDNTPPMQERGILVRQQAPRRLVALLPESVDLDPADLDTEGRDGSGLRARIPWIRVFSSSRAPSVTQGWDVVYLFAADGSAVFLSLNQGTTSASGGSLTDRPEDFLRDRVAWAKRTLEHLDDLPADELSLKDPGGLGAGYEKGNVVARRYAQGAIPDEETLRADLSTFVERLAHLYRAEEDPKLGRGLPGYEQTPSPAHQDQPPALNDVPAFISWMLELNGPELVSTRLDAEQEARDLLNAYAGAMSREQALELGRLFNKGIYG
ncbi:MAG: MrcB family domain-containing protein, partial [Acidimicrobiia bacterium]